MKLVAQVRGRVQLSHDFHVRLTPEALTELIDLPVTLPDGSVVRMEGYDLWLNDDGAYEINPILTKQAPDA